MYSWIMLLYETKTTLLLNYVCISCLVMSSSLWLHGLQTTRLLCPWNFPGKNTGTGCMPFSRWSSQPRGRTQISHMVGRFFTVCATREAGKQKKLMHIINMFGNVTLFEMANGFNFFRATDILQFSGSQTLEETFDMTEGRWVILKRNLL